MSRRTDRRQIETVGPGIVTRILCSNRGLHDQVDTGIVIVDQRAHQHGSKPVLQGGSRGKWSADGRKMLRTDAPEPATLRPYEQDWDAEDAGVTYVISCPQCPRHLERREDTFPLTEIVDGLYAARPDQRTVELYELEALLARYDERRSC